MGKGWVEAELTIGYSYIALGQNARKTPFPVGFSLLRSLPLLC
jgi:hypothetical protein